MTETNHSFGQLRLIQRTSLFPSNVFWNKMKSFKSFTVVSLPMSQPPQYLKTQELADALGIGVSTLKRWVDSGRLSAAKTVGKHRLIALDEALQFAKRHQLATAGLERLADPGPPITVDGGIGESLIASLKEGQPREARRLIAAAHAAYGDGSTLADKLIGPVMERVGHGWSVGAWDVFEEHQASQIVADAISERIARMIPVGDAPAPVAIGAGPEGDVYTIGLLLGELTLRELGWDVKNLGPNLPLKSLARAIRARRPRLVFVAVCHLADPIRFLNEFAEVSEAARAEGATIVVGGRGLPSEMLPRLDRAVHGARMADLRDVGRELLSKIKGGASDATPSESGRNN